MRNKNKTILALLAIIFLFSSFLCFGGELIVEDKAWEKPNVYRPTPILFLHGFGPGSPATWHPIRDKLEEDYSSYYSANIPCIGLGDNAGSKAYLEIISFQDKNGSVDTYPNGNPGWSDKVNDAVINILQRYDETDKLILICHSMGGLAGRYYMQALGGDGNTDKYVSIDTPHCGAKLASVANGIEVAQVGSLIFGGWGGFLFAVVTEVINQSAVKIGDIDIHGDAANDMDPDGEFITNLMNMGTGSGSKSRCVVGQIGSSKNFLLFGSYYGGDGVVSVRTQQAIDKNGHTTWNFYDTCVVTASHSNAPKSSKTYNQILKWVDKEKPELDLIRVLESIRDNNLSELPEDEGGNWDNKDIDWTEHRIGEDSQPFLLDLDKYGRAYIEGKVDNEYLPATTKVDIKVYKEGETTVVWENTSETSLLKPYAGEEPAPAGFRYEVLFAKDKNTAPAPGVYEIKIFVKNPAGLKSQVKTVKVRIDAGAIAIHNCIELQAMKYNLSGDYYLANDINCTYCTQDPAGACYNDGAGFEPIGIFTGTFDGNGHTVTGLKINRPSTSYVSLFRCISGTVKNVGLIDSSVTGNDYTGGLIGQNNGTITNCYATGAVSSDYLNVGGLIGWNNGTITNCYSTGAVSGDNSVGGLIGRNYNGTITNCYSTGAVTGNDYTGGLIGQNYGGTITNCYATSAVSGDDTTGGLIGRNYNGTITNCYSTGAVSGNYYTGGLIGRNYNGTYNDDFWDTDTSGQATSAGGTGKTTVQMKQQATFTNWDFSSVWDIMEELTYPWLR